MPAGLAFSVIYNAANIQLQVVNALLAGDYNNNGIVDAADYVLWRNGGPLQNDPTPGVQPADYDVWRAHFGQTAGSGSGVESARPCRSRVASQWHCWRLPAAYFLEAVEGGT